jgi:DNA polymerase IV
MAHWSRQILFGDVDAMYASSAIAADPRLAGKVMAVGSPPPRGIITSASYPARRFGVKAAMPTAHALRQCPDLVLVPPDHALYQRMHDRIRTVTERLFPHPIWTSIDEFYGDMTDLQSLHPDPARFAKLVSDTIFDETGLRCTIAIGTGRIIAKVAADCHKPNGLVVIEPGTEAEFLAPLPIRALPGIGPKTGEALNAAGLHRIGDLLDPRWLSTLRRMWGRRLPAIQARARGVDHDPVHLDEGQKSIGHETTFDHDTNEMKTLEETLSAFLTTLAHELRTEELAATQFTIKLKDAHFRIATRQRHFAKPLNYDPAMWQTIRATLQEAVAPHTYYRLIGLSFSGLVPASVTLFDGRTQQAVAAMDQIIRRHGSHVIRLGGLPGRR